MANRIWFRQIDNSETQFTTIKSLNYCDTEQDICAPDATV